MRREGYEVRQDGKYLKFRAVGAGQERYTRAKTLGADYTEEALRERIGKPLIHAKRRTGRTADPAKINLIVDIQSRLRGRGSRYERWLKVHNLKEAAKTLPYLTEHGITEYTTLEKLVAGQTAKRDAAVTTIRQYEQRMERIADLRTHIVNYAKTRDIYLQYRKLPAAKKAAFASTHEDELMLHRAAKQVFEEYGEKKLPAVKDLQVEYKELLEKKRVVYVEYRPLKQKTQELETIKKNVDSLLQINAAQQVREAENAGASNRRRDKNYAAGGIIVILPAAFLLRRLAQGLSDFGRQSKTSVRIFRGFGVLPNKRKADSLSDNERSEIVQKDIPFHCLQSLRFGAPVPACGKTPVP